MGATNNYENTVRLAEEALSRLTPAECAARTGASAFDDSSLTIALLDSEYSIEWAEEEGPRVIRNGVRLDPVDWEGIVLLHHLAQADGSPLSGSWRPFRGLPGAWGGYYISFEKRTAAPLLKCYGDDLDGFVAASAGIGGVPIELPGNADAAYRYSFLPKVPIALQLWVGDEEFDARASVLFDEGAAAQIPIEDLTVSAQILVLRLCRWRNASKPNAVG